MLLSLTGAEKIDCTSNYNLISLDKLATESFCTSGNSPGRRLQEKETFSLQLFSTHSNTPLKSLFFWHCIEVGKRKTERNCKLILFLCVSIVHCNQEILSLLVKHTELLVIIEKIHNIYYDRGKAFEYMCNLHWQWHQAMKCLSFVVISW